MKATGCYESRKIRLAGVVGLACAMLALSTRGMAEDGDTAAPVAIRIMEASVCSTEGFRLRVEIANLTEAVYRLEVCPSLALSCVKDSVVLVHRDDTGYGLWEPNYQRASALEVNLVPGAAYQYPILLGFDRIPEDCLFPGRTLSFQISLRIAEDAWVESKLVELKMPQTIGE